MADQRSWLPQFLRRNVNKTDKDKKKQKGKEERKGKDVKRANKEKDGWPKMIISWLYHAFVLNMPELTIGQALFSVVLTLICVCIFFGTLTIVYSHYMGKAQIALLDEYLQQSVNLQKKTLDVIEKSQQSTASDEGVLVNFARWVTSFW